MADSVILAIVELERSTHVPEDKIVNTWHFVADPAVAGSLTNIRDRLNDFYATDTEQVTNQQPAGERSVINYFGPQIAAGNLHVGRLYDLADAKPRQPLLTWHPNFTEMSTGGFPAELAVCLSYQGEVDSGDDAARMRGRVYLGPLGDGAIVSGDGDGRVAPNFRNVIAKAAERLASSSNWCVYSPTADANGATLLDSTTDAHRGWVDDAVDIQRRRGSRASVRTLWSYEG